MKPFEKLDMPSPTLYQMSMVKFISDLLIKAYKGQRLEKVCCIYRKKEEALQTEICIREELNGMRLPYRIKMEMLVLLNHMCIELSQWPFHIFMNCRHKSYLKIEDVVWTSYGFINDTKTLLNINESFSQISQSYCNCRSCQKIKFACEWEDYYTVFMKTGVCKRRVSYEQFSKTLRSANNSMIAFFWHMLRKDERNKGFYSLMHHYSLYPDSTRFAHSCISVLKTLSKKECRTAMYWHHNIIKHFVKFWPWPYIVIDVIVAMRDLKNITPESFIHFCKIIFLSTRTDKSNMLTNVLIEFWLTLYKHIELNVLSSDCANFSSEVGRLLYSIYNSDNPKKDKLMKMIITSKLFSKIEDNTLYCDYKLFSCFPHLSKQNQLVQFLTALEVATEDITSIEAMYT